MALEKFHYTIGKTEIALPHLSKLPLGIVRKSRKLPEDERMWLIFETLFAEGSRELNAIDSLDSDGLADLMDKWQDFSGVGLGESTPS